jgi:hypothetical protein
MVQGFATGARVINAERVSIFGERNGLTVIVELSTLEF